MQQVDPWDIPHPSNVAPQSYLPRTPAPQTGDQATITHEAAIRAHDQNQHIDPDTLRMMAQRYVTDGVQPNFGMGNAVDRRNFWEAVAHEVGSAGATGGDLAVRIRQFHNSSHALQTLENQLGTISGNEQSARGYAEQALSALRALDPGNSWAPTNWLRNIVGDTTNDPNLGTWDSARNTLLTEYGKVVAGSPSGAGVLSDSARREQMALLRRTTNPQQAEAIIGQFLRDMDIRHNSLQANIQRGYENMRAGHTISFNPQGEMLDERGNIVPVAGGGRNDGGSDTPPTFTGLPPHPPAGGSPTGGAPPGSAPGGERMDRSTVNMGARGPDTVALNTGTMHAETDPALAGINAHISGMIGQGATSEQILGYAHDRGSQLDPAHLAPILAWRDSHPNYRGSYDVQLDQRLVPQSAVRQGLTNFADSAPGAAVIAAGNTVAGQQIPNIVGATGGDAELARVGMNEVANRHPYATLAGDVGGGAMLYAGGAAGVRAGMAGVERAAPGVYARLPAWVTGAEAGAAEGTAAEGGGLTPVNPYSGTAATNTALAPTATFAPRAIAGDATIGAYESPGNRREGALVGGLTGIAGRGAINTVGRAVSPTGGDLAPAYEEGVQPTLGQRMGGVGNRFEQAFQSIPLVGGIQRGARSAAQDQWQIGGFNRALRNLPDEPQLPAGTQPGTAPHAFAQDAFDTAYDRVHQRVRVVNDDELQQDLANIRQNSTLLSDQSLSHFNRVLENSVERRLGNPPGMSTNLPRPATPQQARQLPTGTHYVDPNGATRVRSDGAFTGDELQAALTGDELQAALSEVRRTARSLRSSPVGDRELASMLDDVSEALHNNAVRHSAPEAIQTLNGINKGYAMLVRIENAANRAGAGDPGEYTAKGLMNAERQQGGLRGRQWLAGNGLMDNYAKAGLRLGQTVPDSGTPERLMTMGAGTGTAAAIGAGAHFVSPYVAAPWAMDTFANLPIVRQSLNWALKPNRASIRPITDEIRAQIQARAGVGSAIGLPAVVAAYGNGP